MCYGRGCSGDGGRRDSCVMVEGAGGVLRKRGLGRVL